MTTIEKICKLMTENYVNDATVIKACELNHSALYDWKKGKSKPTTEALTKIANYFNVSTDYLLGLPIPEYQKIYESLTPKGKELALIALREVQSRDKEEVSISTKQNINK